MKLELRSLCERFKKTLIADFDDRLNELKDKQPPYEYNRELHKVHQRYYDWILGCCDEYGKRIPHTEAPQRSSVTNILIDHMVALTGNKALGIWLSKQDVREWERIIWDMYEVQKAPYYAVLYRFTYAAICAYLTHLHTLFTINWGDEEGGSLYRSALDKLASCLKVKECTYWSTTEE